MTIMINTEETCLAKTYGYEKDSFRLYEKISEKKAHVAVYVPIFELELSNSSAKIHKTDLIISGSAFSLRFLKAYVLVKYSNEYLSGYEEVCLAKTGKFVIKNLLDSRCTNLNGIGPWESDELTFKITRGEVEGLDNMGFLHHVEFKYATAKLRIKRVKLKKNKLYFGGASIVVKDVFLEGLPFVREKMKMEIHMTPITVPRDDESDSTNNNPSGEGRNEKTKTYFTGGPILVLGGLLLIYMIVYRCTRRDDPNPAFENLNSFPIYTRIY